MVFMRTLPPSRHASRASAPFLARVRRHLAVLIVAKIVFLALLYVLFFSASQRPEVTPERVDRLLFPSE
jgi:hypothetical protein